MDNIFQGATIGDARRLLATKLQEVTDSREAMAVAQLAMEHVTRLSRVELALHAPQPLSEYEITKLTGILDRLLKNEPIQYILGEAEWGGLKLKVTPAVLIPRPETAQLVDIVSDRWGNRQDLRVLDVCTGSGCIAIALALRLKFATVDAVDISSAAIDIAHENAARYKVNVEFRSCDVLDGLEACVSGTYDIIVSNPPYIAECERSGMEAHVLDYEPGLALFVPDADPLRFYRAVMEYASEALAPGGGLYFEINPLYADELQGLAKKVLPGRDIDIVRDLYGRNRFMIIS